MQFKIFTISVFDEQKTEEMNRFLRGNKIVNVEKQLLSLGGNAYWAFCVQYIGIETAERNIAENKAKIDYKTVLDEKTFEVFSKLRAFRKKIAENDAVPAYAVFTDAELAEITPQNLHTINGNHQFSIVNRKSEIVNNKGLPIGNLTSQYFANHADAKNLRKKLLNKCCNKNGDYGEAD